MKKGLIISITCLFFICISQYTNAQCALCTRTAQQLGEKPAQGLNSGILYLMLMPFALVSVIGYRWWRGNGRNAS
jgi:hypothetical protein